MNCLKCGKDIPLSQVFCEDCQQNMDNYPVEPGVPVVIIPRADLRPEKEQRRKRKGYADTVRTYRKAVRNLSIALSAAILLVIVLAGCLTYAIGKLETANTPGKNYTTVETDTRS